MVRTKSLIAAFALVLAAGAAQAKPAQCFTTDDGAYACDFTSLDRAGSFAIAAQGRPTVTLWVDEPGIAFGSINFGDRDVALPGAYERETGDPACWSNAGTDTRICAW